MAVKHSPVPPKLAALGKAELIWLQGVANKRAASQDDSTAATLADLVTDFNALLAKLRAAGMMDE